MVRTRKMPSGPTVLKGASGQSLWTVTQEWSWDWELKYAQWIKDEIDRDWWLKNNLATDCADVAYSARWIFARNNGLPMANRLASGQWFTQDSVKPEWARLPTGTDWQKDKRFLAALNYMLDFVFTHTLWNDSYPIAITPESLIPGAYHLSLHSRSGHTQFVYRVGLNRDEVPVLTLNSTVPRAVRELAEYIFFGQVADVATNAFLRMRWPVSVNGQPGLKDPGTMPFFSTEQFDSNFVQSPRSAFWEEVFYRLNPGADFNAVALKTARQIVDLIKARIEIVEEGYLACRATLCPAGSAEFEVWSTPSRDARIKATIESYDKLSQFISRWDLISPILEAEILSQDKYSFSVAQLMSVFRMDLFSSDPNDDLFVRWVCTPARSPEGSRAI